MLLPDVIIYIDAKYIDYTISHLLQNKHIKLEDISPNETEAIMDRDMKLETGKIPMHILEEIVFHNIGKAREEVVLSARYRWRMRQPLIWDQSHFWQLQILLLARRRKAGWLAVKVSLNDIAAAGGEPICLLVTLLLPEDARLSDLYEIVADINEACLEEGVQVAGGHTEVTPGLLQPVISVAALWQDKKSKDFEFCRCESWRRYCGHQVGRNGRYIYTGARFQAYFPRNSR